MLTNHDIHKFYIDKMHAKIRTLNMIVLIVIAVAIGLASVSFYNTVLLTKERDRLMVELERCKQLD